MSVIASKPSKQARFPADSFCYGLAFLVLSLGIPFYALNRSQENFASCYCLAIISQLPDSAASILSECMIFLKRFPVLGEGFPSFIWCFSWTLALTTLWHGSRNAHLEGCCWCLLPLLSNFAWEYLQYAGVIDGSGAWTDVWLGTCGAAIAFGIGTILLKTRRAPT